MYSKKYSDRVVAGVDYKYCSPWTFNFELSKFEANKVTFILSRPLETATTSEITLYGRTKYTTRHGYFI